MSSVGITLMWIAIGIVGLFILLWFFPITLWFQALISGVRVSLIQLVLMRWRKVPPSTIVMAMITGTKAGLKMDVNAMEAHYLAKGNIIKVVNALISADKANIPLDFKMAAAIDLAGRDVFEAVQMSVNPKVINTPPVSAVAKDGIQLNVSRQEIVPPEFTVKAGQPVILKVSAVDQWTHILVFDGNLSGLTIGLNGGENKVLVFNAPEKAGEYPFHDDIFGVAGKMIVQ